MIPAAPRSGGSTRQKQRIKVGSTFITCEGVVRVLHKYSKDRKAYKLQIKSNSIQKPHKVIDNDEQ